MPARRARRAHRGQDRAQDDGRDGAEVRHTPRDRLPQVQLVRGSGRRDLRERARLRLRLRRAVAEDGHRRHRVQVLVREGLPRPGVRLRQPRDRGVVDIRVARHGAAGGDARHADLPDAGGRPAGAAVRHGLAVPERPLRLEAAVRRHRAEHVAQGQLPGQRLHRGAVRPHEGRVLPRSRLGRLRVVQGGP